ncbi:MAG: hypothetical protein M3R12_12630 [Actinomycetota bacterium]|nr:hypothetical protein [Actinomycetota bacterium]
MSFRRDRFADLVRRQLDLFAEDDAELLREADEAERAYDGAERAAAEELFGDYQLVLEAITERLEEIRDTYASSLEVRARDEYERSFDRLAARRYPRSFGTTSRP